jgi:hypothetical protein
MPSNRSSTYWVHRECSDCGKTVEDPDGLLTRIVLWRTVGKGGKSRRSRTDRYQCLACAALDPVWQKQQWVDSPGMKGLKSAP